MKSNSLRFPVIICNGYRYRIRYSSGIYEENYSGGDPETGFGRGWYVFETRFWWRANRRLQKRIRYMIRSANLVRSTMSDEYHII